LTQDADPSPPPELERLRKRPQFLAVAKGRSLARGGVVIQILPRAEGPEAAAGPALIGVGFTATRKIGGAVVRNRAKRRLREAARQLLPLHGLPAHDYVVIARAGAATRPWARLLDDVKSALISLAAGGDDARPARKPRSPAPPRPA
jgi:ribonuclease P protein component